MSTIGISMVKDEIDVLPYTLANMLDQVDAIIAADNGSTDGTLEHLDDLARGDDRLTVVGDPEVGYWQSAKMSGLAARAAAAGAEFVVPFDADEWWYSPFGRIGDVLHEHPGAVATAAIYDHRVSGEDDQAEPNPIKRMGWRTRDPLPLHKVACRPVLPVTIAQGNHATSYPTQDPLHGAIVLRHYPYRSVEQMIRKARNGAAAYAATDLPESAGEHWRSYGRLSDEQLHEVFHTWFHAAEPREDGTLIFDPAPGCLATSL